MAYTKTNWIEDVTPTSPTNMNKIEQGIADAHAAIFEVGDIKWTSRKFTADPTGWALGDGRAITTAMTTLAALRAAYIADGNPYGADGSGNPFLPDPRDRTLIGINPAVINSGLITQRSVRALGAAGGQEGVILI